MVVDHHFKGSNKEQWDQLLFVLEERDKPTFIVIGFNSYAIQKSVFKALHEELSNYRFHILDLSAKQITSLNQAFRSELPVKILNSKPVEYIVNVVGLENSFFTIEKNIMEESSLLSELNFEREILFQGFPFVTILWTDLYIIDRLRKEAKDLWDWISYFFEFKMDSNDIYALSSSAKVFSNSEHLLNNNDKIIRVFISYNRQNIALAKRLYKDLQKEEYIQPWMDITDISPGQNWKKVIRSAISSSTFFLALLSSYSITKKGYFQYEMKAALDIMEEIPPGLIYFIPVYAEHIVNVEDERLKNIQGLYLYPSYENGLQKLLNLFRIIKEEDILTSAENKGAVVLQKSQGKESISRIKELEKKFDTLQLDKSSKERIIREKISIQKLLGKEYLWLEDYTNAEKAFRIALALSQQSSGFEHEKEEIAFLLNQVHYQPPEED